MTNIHKDSLMDVTLLPVILWQSDRYALTLMSPAQIRQANEDLV